jgi:hypothetical protein
MGVADRMVKQSETVSVQPVPTARRRIGVFESVNDTNEAFYAPIEAYEGRHRYDPEFEWEPNEEKRLVRKVSDDMIDIVRLKRLASLIYYQIDWRICSWACLMFFALQLDRSNIVQALADNMLDVSHPQLIGMSLRVLIRIRISALPRTITTTDKRSTTLLFSAQSCRHNLFLRGTRHCKTLLASQSLFIHFSALSSLHR